ncbi:hypothetical protein VP01_1442g4 [Puccinia sorghi]|uniref:Uncharacterized protein n=1 Tax=Puccinia sorghi TaxID=27349 RepID=A0A0L6VK59_9BASI|nr:hypothetical protein VP01_1442g4 [Puccinia sorghi]
MDLLEPAAVMDLSEPAAMLDFSEPAVMDSVELELEANKDRSRKLLQELQNLENICAQKNDRLVHKQRKPNTMIKPEVCNLICENVIQNGMSLAQARKMFKVSQCQIQRIKFEDPNAIKVNKKPGRFTK